MGDFNAIRSDAERKGAEGYSRRTDTFKLSTILFRRVEWNARRRILT
jgi:hypothetical protein